jgi:cyanate permease
MQHEDPAGNHGSTPRSRVHQARVLAGAVIGCATGISALLLYTNGLFVAGLTAEFGLTRTQFGFGVLLVTLAIAAANPLVGWAVDRFGAKWPSIAGLLLLSAGFAMLGWSVRSVTSYLLLQPLVAFAAAASGPVAFSKLVSAAFDRRRGLALGLTMAGIGLAAAFVPPRLAAHIVAHGWRAGYLALSMLPLAGTVLLVVILPARADAVPTNRAPGLAAAGEGMSPGIDSRVFWILAAAFATMSLAFTGMLPHFVPMLTDAGLDPVAAGRIAGQIGLAVISSRLLIGFLLDRLFAPRIAIAVCLLAAAGCALFIARGTAAATLTAIALGFAIGAELDLMGFLVARYFGLAGFGRIYGWLYGAFVAASGLAPLWVGALRDATGSYTLPLALCIVGLIAACGVLLLLPRYPAVSFRR